RDSFPTRRSSDLSAIRSSAAHCSVYWVSNIRCRVLNIGPVMFQWKPCVFRYSVYASARQCDSPSAMRRRSLAVSPMSIAGAADAADAGLRGAALREPVLRAEVFDLAMRGDSIKGGSPTIAPFIVGGK